MTMRNYEPCHCDGVRTRTGRTFPHRPGGGQCEHTALTQDERDHEEWERSLTRKQCLEWQKARDAGVD